MTNKLVYTVENDGAISPNYSTGTRIYSRKGNALQRVPSGSWNRGQVCVEYEMVPTGNVFDGEGELIDEPNQ